MAFLVCVSSKSSFRISCRFAAETAAADQLTTSAVPARIRQSANQHLKPSKFTITE